MPQLDAILIEHPVRHHMGVTGIARGKNCVPANVMDGTRLRDGRGVGGLVVTSIRRLVCHDCSPFLLRVRSRLARSSTAPVFAPPISSSIARLFLVYNQKP